MVSQKDDISRFLGELLHRRWNGTDEDMRIHKKRKVGVLNVRKINIDYKKEAGIVHHGFAQIILINI